MAAVSLDALQGRMAGHHLEVVGGFSCENDPTLPPGSRSLVLIGPREPGYWAHMLRQPECAGPDPVDRWSQRVLEDIAADLGATALFPFGGKPYHPFFSWALRSGQIWESPIRLLVHSTQGLMISFRGALALPFEIDLPSPPPRPCDTCAAPCLTACPVNALTGAGYDLPACHGQLDRSGGASCMNGGCLARRACPVSATYARMDEHSAYHMRQFHRAG